MKSAPGTWPTSGSPGRYRARPRTTGRRATPDVPVRRREAPQMFMASTSARSSRRCTCVRWGVHFRLPPMPSLSFVTAAARRRELAPVRAVQNSPVF